LISLWVVFSFRYSNLGHILDMSERSLARASLSSRQGVLDFAIVRTGVNSVLSRT